MAVTLAQRRAQPPDPDPRRRPRSWRSSSSTAAPRCPARSSPPATRTPPCPSSPPRSSPRRRWSCATCRGSATSTAMLELLEALGVRVEWRGDHEVALCAAGVDRRPRSTGASPSASARPSCSPARCWPASAAPSCRRRAATSSADAGSTRTSTRSARSARASASSDGDVVIEAPRPAPAGRRGLHGRAVGHGDRERADGRGADAGRDVDRQRRLRAPRAGPRAHARQDGRRDHRHRLQRHPVTGRRRARRLRPTTSAPTTSRSARSWRSPA